MDKKFQTYKGIELYFTTDRSIEDIASEVKLDPKNLAITIDNLYNKCLEAYEIYLRDDVTQGKAAESAGINKSIFLLFLKKYSLPLDDYDNGRAKLEELKHQTI